MDKLQIKPPNFPHHKRIPAIGTNFYSDMSFERLPSAIPNPEVSDTAGDPLTTFSPRFTFQPNGS